MTSDTGYERLDEPDEEHGRHSGGRHRRGSAVPVWAWVGGGVLGLLLVANLVLAIPSLRSGGDAPGTPLLTPGVVEWLMLWGPALVALGLAGAGLAWSGVALSRYDRTSVRWMRMGFAVACVAVLALVIAVFEEVESMEVVAMCALASVLAPFAWAARKAARSRHGGGRKRRSKDGDDARDPDGADDAEGSG